MVSPVEYEFVATGDVHLSNELPHARPTKDGMTDRFESELRMLRQIAEIAGDRPIYVVGDLYDKARLDPITLVETLKVMRERGFWRVLPGNHDANSLTGGRFNVEIFRDIDRSHFDLLEGTYGLSDRWKLHAVPFAAIEDNAKTIAEIQAKIKSDGRHHLLMLHNAVLGCKVDGDWRSDHGLKASEICKGFNKVIAGHFHTHQRFGKIGMYLGAPMQHKFSDEGERRGVWIFSLHSDGTVSERFEPLDMPRFWTIAPGASPPSEARHGDYIRYEAKATSAEWAASSGDVALQVADLERAGFVASAKHVPAYQHDKRIEEADATLLSMSLAMLTERYVSMPDVEIGSLDRAHVLKLGREFAAAGEADRCDLTTGSVQIVKASFVNMFPFGKVNVKLENRGLVSVSGRNEDSDGAANNGAGKTSLYKALTWTIYGQTTDGESGDRPIRKGAKSASGCVVFRAGGELWEVKRTRTAGNTKLELIAPDGKAFNGKKKDLQRHINDLIGLDFRAFRSTVLYGKTDKACFAAPEASDAERKDILHSILRTSMFAAAHNAAKERVEFAKASLGASREELARARGRLEGADASREDALSATWTRSRSERVAKAQRERDASQRRLDGLVRDDARINAIKARQAEIEEIRKAGSAASAQIFAAKSLRDTAEKNARAAEKKHAEMKGKISAREESIEDLDGDACPTCKSPLGEGHAAQHLADEHAAIASMRLELDALASQVTQAKSALQDSKAKLSRLEASLPQVDAKEVAKLASELAACEGVDKVRAEIAKTIKAHEKTISAIEAEKDPHAARAAEMRIKREGLEAEVARLELEVRAAQADVAAAQFWVHGFGPSGLPSIVLDSVMPKLTERANHYLAILADGDIVGEFRTQRTLASGDVRDKIEMSWTIEGNVDVTPSGGQQTKINLAVGLALMDLAAERSSVDIVLIDEVLDGLDAEGTRRMLDLLCDLRARKRSVFVVSHEQGMSEVFEAGLMVVKRDRVSTIEEVK